MGKGVFGTTTFTRTTAPSNIKQWMVTTQQDAPGCGDRFSIQAGNGAITKPDALTIWLEALSLSSIRLWSHGHYNYDAAGRTSSFSGTLGDGANRTYASNTTYTAGGQMQEERFGTTTPLYHKLRYNSRGQLYDIRLSTVAWATDPLNWNRGCLAFYHDSGYHWGGLPGIDTGLDNNGNVLRVQYSRPGDDQITTFSATEQNYVYDELNRLRSVMEYYQTG